MEQMTMGFGTKLEPLSNIGYLYVMASTLLLPEKGKVGMAGDPEDRLRTFQTADPDLNLLHILPVPKRVLSRVEAIAHSILAEYRVHPNREFFWLKKWLFEEKKWYRWLQCSGSGDAFYAHFVVMFLIEALSPVRVGYVYDESPECVDKMPYAAEVVDNVRRLLYMPFECLGGAYTVPPGGSIVVELSYHDRGPATPMLAVSPDGILWQRDDWGDGFAYWSPIGTASFPPQFRSGLFFANNWWIK